MRGRRDPSQRPFRLAPQLPPLMLRSKITGLGMALPPRCVTNDDLADVMDTSDEWIVQRTGIKERRIAAQDQVTSTLAIAAARQALEHANVDANDLDLLELAVDARRHDAHAECLERGLLRGEARGEVRGRIREAVAVRPLVIREHRGFEGRAIAQDLRETRNVHQVDAVTDAGRCRGHWTESPPSTVNDWPVM